MIQTVTINPSLDRYYDIDHIVLDGLHRVKEVRDMPGGKGINMSRVLNELHMDSCAYGFIGGHTGDELSKLCKSMNTQLIRIANSTRINHKFRDLQDFAITEFNESGPEINEKEFRILEHCLSRDIFEGDICMLGGSACKGLGDDVYVKLMENVRHRGGKVLVSCDMPWIKPAIEQLPDVVKLNIGELTRLAGKSFDNNEEILAYMREWIHKGISMFIVSMGEEGAIFATAKEAYYAEKIDIVCKNDVGAGDAMLAGICYAMVEHYALREIATFSIACATAAITNDDISVDSLEYVKKLEAMAKVHEM